MNNMTIAKTVAASAAFIQLYTDHHARSLRANSRQIPPATAKEATIAKGTVLSLVCGSGVGVGSDFGSGLGWGFGSGLGSGSGSGVTEAPEAEP